MSFSFVSGGCASDVKNGAPPPPSITLAVDHFVGTPLTGPLARVPPSAAAADTPGVRVTFVTLTESPRRADGLNPIGARAALMTASTGGAAVMPSARLARDALIAEGDAAAALLDAARAGAFGPASDVATLTGAIPPDVTARFAAADPAGSLPDGRGVEIEAHAPTVPAAKPGAPPATRPAAVPATAPAAGGKVVRLALRVTDLVAVTPPPSTGPADTASPSGVKGPPEKSAPAARKATAPPPVPVRKEMRREDVLLDRPLDGGGHDRVALLVPFRFAGTSSNALLVFVEIRPGAANDAAHAEAAGRALADASRAATDAKGKRNTTPGGAPQISGVRAGAFAALGRSTGHAERRAALLYLADRTGGNAAADVALVADESTLAQISAAVTAAANADPILAATDAGWLVDRTTLALLSERLTAAALAPELSAALSRRGGDLARRPDALAELLKAATGSQDLDNRIEAENLIALEDSSPAARVRGFDYLQSRGKAPAGYDPLGPARARRAALEKAMAAPVATRPAPTAATK